jgi:hypothetical protein
MLIRANTTTIGSKNITAYLKATKELPHKIMAKSKAAKGTEDEIFIGAITG